MKECMAKKDFGIFSESFNAFLSKRRREKDFPILIKQTRVSVEIRAVVVATFSY